MRSHTQWGPESFTMAKVYPAPHPDSINLGPPKLLDRQRQVLRA